MRAAPRESQLCNEAVAWTGVQSSALFGNIYRLTKREPSPSMIASQHTRHKAARRHGPAVNLSVRGMPCEIVNVSLGKQL